jgi:hypothetical protein
MEPDERGGDVWPERAVALYCAMLVFVLLVVGLVMTDGQQAAVNAAPSSTATPRSNAGADPHACTDPNAGTDAHTNVDGDLDSDADCFTICRHPSRRPTTPTPTSTPTPIPLP